MRRVFVSAVALCGLSTRRRPDLDPMPSRRPMVMTRHGHEFGHADDHDAARGLKARRAPATR